MKYLAAATFKLHAFSRAIFIHCKIRQMLLNNRINHCFFLKSCFCSIILGIRRKYSSFAVAVGLFISILYIIP